MEVRDLTSAPSMLPLYARALVGPLVPGGGSEVPDHAVELRRVAIDPIHLADYCHVCGFALRDRLPSTYLHILAFPLAMSLMTERSFPFPLLGTVHIANRIEHRRPVPVDAEPSLRVWVESLRPHRRGRQLDLVAEAALDGTLVWREVSTYLRRGGGGEGQERRRQDERLEPSGEVAATWRIPGDVGRRYAAVSGDRNPIHLHGLAARPFGFGGAIAHGMWMKARCLAALDGRLPDAFETAVEFRSPLPIPGRARLRLGREDGGWRFALEPPDGERVHLVGTVAGAAR